MRVLFVDDEPNILSGLKRSFRPLREQWDMTFVESGRDALALAAENPFDVVVSDMKMPGMDGAQLLSKIKEQYPQSIRIALSGETDSHMIYRCVQHAHQYISKPCNTDVLVGTVQRAFALRDLMNDDVLKTLISNLSTLPSLPEQYNAIMQELESEDPSLGKIAEIVESDVAMTAKILQLVNSSFFGLVRQLSLPSEAAMYLGVDVIRSLVLTTGIFSQFDDSRIPAARLQSIWNRSMQTGALAREIVSQHTKSKLLSDYAFMGGLMADVGKLIFASSLSEQFVRVDEIVAADNRRDWEVEREIIGYSHMDVGAYLVGLWGLPNPVVECVAYHHVPADCVEADFSPLAGVHIAHAIVSANDDSDVDNLDKSYIEFLGVGDKMPGWLKLYNDMDALDSRDCESRSD